MVTDFKIADRLYIEKDKDSSDYNKIYFRAYSFYGHYTIAEFDEFLCQLISEFLKIREAFIDEYCSRI